LPPGSKVVVYGNTDNVPVGAALQRQGIVDNLDLSHSEEFVGSWTNPEGMRPWLGALLLAYDDRDGRLVPAVSAPASTPPSLNGYGTAARRYISDACIEPNIKNLGEFQIFEVRRLMAPLVPHRPRALAEFREGPSRLSDRPYRTLR
jgi:hypothetical protein